jgi:predicted DsbA family dithiol-disulfide isomerase
VIRKTLDADAPPLVLYEDPLSPWCLIAERRVAAALEELPGVFAPLRHAPFPLRPEPRALTRAERRELARAARRAAREPEARGLTADLWLSPDAPAWSIPALTALAAARLQGATREAALREAIREAAFVKGMNVARTDVLVELADHAGLDVARFSGALAAGDAERRVLADFEEALGKGIDGAPALVIGEEWLVSGPRAIEEYRAVLRRYAQGRLGVASQRILH